jgi:hypothetical protein
MVLTATNVTSPASVITTSAILNISAPSLSQTSFAFAGTIGSTDAQPTLTWSNSGGTVASYSLVVYGDTNSSPTTTIATITSITSGQTSYYYTPTVASYYYKYVLTATNGGGSNTLTTSVIVNLAAPSITLGTLTFDGTVGGAAANPKITWSNSGGDVASYSIVLWYDATTPPTSKLTLTPAPAAGDTSYTYTGTTTTNYYYSFDLVAINAGGSSTISKPTAIQNIAFTSSSPSIVTKSGQPSGSAYTVTVNWSKLNSATRYYLTVSLSATAFHAAFSSTINTTGLTGTITINDNVGNNTANISLYAINASSQSSLTTTTTVFINGVAS